MSSHLAANQIARRQHALITHDQALAAGLSRTQIRRRCRSGEWTATRPGVYAVTGAPPTQLQSIAAVALCAQPRAWISHQTAAALWGVRAMDDDMIHVLTGLDRRVRLGGVRGHRSSALFTADLTTIQRLPVVTPARALVDISAAQTYRALGSAVDDLLRRRVMTLAALRSCVARLEAAPGRRMSILHELLAERLPGYDPGESDLETRVLRILIAHGFPPPVQQHRIRVGGRTIRVDLAYPALRLAIELDGWEFHGTRTVFDDDRARANLLVAAGWIVVRFTSRSSDAEIVECLRAFGQLGVA